MTEEEKGAEARKAFFDEMRRKAEEIAEEPQGKRWELMKQAAAEALPGNESIGRYAYLQTLNLEIARVEFQKLGLELFKIEAKGE